MALGRQIALFLALLIVPLTVLGCGSGDESTNAEIDPAVATAINEKLDRVQERFDANDCFGDDSAESSLVALQDGIDSGSLDVGDGSFKSDLLDLLGQLEDQLREQCQESTEPPSTSSSTTTSTTESTTSSTDSTSTDDTKSTSSTTTDPTQTTPAPNNPGNGNGPATPEPPAPGGGGGPGGTDPGEGGGLTPKSENR